MSRRRPLLILAIVIVARSASCSARGSDAARGQQLPPTVAAVIDYQRILRDAAAARSIREQIETRRKAYQGEISKEEQRLHEADKEFAKQRSLLTPEAFAEKRQDFEEDVSEVQRLVQQRRRELDRAAEVALNEVKTALIEIVTGIAEERGFNLVLPSSEVLFFARRIDLTEEVLAKLDAMLPDVVVAASRRIGHGRWALLRAARAVRARRARGHRRGAPLRRRSRSADPRRRIARPMRRRDQITFLDNPRYLAQARGTRAAACLVRPAHADRLPDGVARLITDEPYRGYAQDRRRASIPRRQRLAPTIRRGRRLRPARRSTRAPGSARAAGSPAGAVIEARRRDRAALPDRRQRRDRRRRAAGRRLHGRAGRHAQPLPDRRARGDPCRRAHRPGRLRLRAWAPAGHLKVPQVGRVLIDDDVEIGANTTIDRGSSGDTVIGRGCKIDNLVMIAHNVRLGPHCIVVAQSGISGSTQIGAGSMLAAQVGITGHLTLGPSVRLAARSAVIRDLPGGDTYGGVPAVPIRPVAPPGGGHQAPGQKKGSEG